MPEVKCEPANQFYTDEQKELIAICASCTQPPDACDDAKRCPYPPLRRNQKPLSARIQHRCGKEQLSDYGTWKAIQRDLRAAEKRIFGSRLSLILKVEGIGA